MQADARITYRYNQHLNKEFKDNTSRRKEQLKPIRSVTPLIAETDAVTKQKQRIENEILNPNIHYYKKFQKMYKLKKRTFKTELDKDVIFDVVKMVLQEECSKCKGELLAPQLRKALELKAQKKKKCGGSVEAVCTYCGNPIKCPKLKIQVGKRIRKRMPDAQSE